MQAHNFSAKRIAGKPYCSVLLRNDLTEWCVKRGCDYAESLGLQDGSCVSTRAVQV